MSRISAAIERWWHSVSLRAKITGVTVLLLAFGLIVAGAGTMTVLRGYLLEEIDTRIIDQFESLDGQSVTIDDIRAYDEVDAGNTPFYVAAVSPRGILIEDNLSGGQSGLRPDVSGLVPEYVDTLRGAITLESEDHSTEWRLVAVSGQVETPTGTAILVVGQSLRETEALIARYALIYFLFALAVVLFCAAATQLLVTSTFAPLRDVEATAARFANGDYSQRLGGATPNTEVGRLNRSLNQMLARIDRAFADRDRAVTQMRRFIGDASHELRTPLVSVRGYAELYRMGALQGPDDVAQAMDRIEREAIRMSGLVEDLLELARLDEATPLKLAPVELLPIAQDAALDAVASAPQRQVRVVVVEPVDRPAGASGRPANGEPALARRRTVWRSGQARQARPGRPAVKAAERPTREQGAPTGAIAAIARLGRRRRPGPTPPDEPVRPVLAPAPLLAPAPQSVEGPVVLGAENKLRQVVTNLLGNAMRFTPVDSPIELEVSTDLAGGYGQLAVVDHGEGIPPQLREKIFQRFWRADTSRTRETGGSGLGLAIVAGIVASHNGHVEVLETPGGGATFRVSIPLAPRSPERELSTEPTDEAAAVDASA